jgi:hypothetical protein
MTPQRIKELLEQNPDRKTFLIAVVHDFEKEFSATWTSDDIGKLANEMGYFISRTGARMVIHQLKEEFDPLFGISNNDVMVLINRLPREHCAELGAREKTKCRREGIQDSDPMFISYQYVQRRRIAAKSGRPLRERPHMAPEDGGI